MISLYIRTSTNKQDNGLQAQRRTLETYCERIGVCDYKVFCDNGVSGSKASRPELDELMSLVSQGSIKKVIVYSLSRLARSTRHLLDVLDLFNKMDVELVSLTENIDTATPFGRALFTIMAAIGQLERELISERVKNGLVNARAKNKRIGRPIKRNNLLLNTLFEQGLTVRKIAAITNTSVGSVGEQRVAWRTLSERNAQIV